MLIDALRLAKSIPRRALVGLTVHVEGLEGSLTGSREVPVLWSETQGRALSLGCLLGTIAVTVEP